jgi:hypothetical protein
MIAILLSPRLWIALAIACLLGWTHLTAYKAGKDRVQARWDVAKASEAMQRASDLEQALATQRGLQTQIDKLRKDARNEVARINRTHALALDGLRNRPEARASDTAGVPPAAGTGIGCTGQGLARPDAEFLAEFSADAARLQAAFDQCRAGYQAAKERLDGAGGVMKDGAP